MIRRTYCNSINKIQNQFMLQDMSMLDSAIFTYTNVSNSLWDLLLLNSNSMTPSKLTYGRTGYIINNVYLSREYWPNQKEVTHVVFLEYIFYRFNQLKQVCQNVDHLEHHTDSQAAIMALSFTIISSKLVLKCLEKLNNLRKGNRVAGVKTKRTAPSIPLE